MRFYVFSVISYLVYIDLCTIFLTCSVIKFVILTIVCRSKSFFRAYVTYYVYSTLNKSSMSMSIIFSSIPQAEAQVYMFIYMYSADPVVNLR